MKYISNILRILVGALFIFSGLIKSNDPTGFSYKLDEYFSVFSEDLKATQDSIIFEFTTGTDTTTLVKHLFPHSYTSPITAERSTWMKLPTADNPKDSLWAGSARVFIDGTEVLNQWILAGDTGTTLLTANVNIIANGAVVDTKTLPFKSYQSNEQSLDLDFQDRVKSDNFIVGWLQKMRAYVIPLAILICVFEVLLGLALLIGFAPKLTIWLSLIMIIFFTFLTWYSAHYNKVTDCGCFGDAIKLTPWESFTKDAVLLGALLIMLLGIKHIKEIFRTPFGVKLLTVFTLLSLGFSLYCWHYLPVKNFLKFAVGSDIKTLAVVPENAAADVYEHTYIYKKDGVDETFSAEDIAGRNLKEEGYEFVDRISVLIEEGYPLEIHDFRLLSEDRETDYVDSFFASENYKLMIVIEEVEKARESSMKTIRSYLKPWQKAGHEVYVLTSSDNVAVEEFRHKHQLSVPFYYGDKTNLKSIVRSNPGVLLFKGNVIEAIWPSTRLPDLEKITSYTK